MATVTLTWQAPASGGSVASYKVYRKAGAGHTAAAVKLPANQIAANISSSTTTFADTTLASNSGAHCWVVTAVNTGGESDPSNVTPQTL